MNILKSKVVILLISAVLFSSAAIGQTKITGTVADNETKVDTKVEDKVADKVETKVETKVADNVADKVETKVTVKRVTINGVEYLKSTTGVLYDEKTKEEMGIYDEETKTIKAIEYDDEEEEEEDEYEY